MTETTALVREDSDAETGLGTLPVWDLGDLYPSPDAPEIAVTSPGCGRRVRASPLTTRRDWRPSIPAASSRR